MKEYTVDECMDFYFELRKNRNNLTYLQIKISNKIGFIKTKNIFNLINEAKELLSQADSELQKLMYEEFDKIIVTKEIMDGSENNRQMDELKNE
jgi:hypothetical protein